MNTANTATYDRRSEEIRCPALAARAVAGLTEHCKSRSGLLSSDLLSGTVRPASRYAASDVYRQLREEGESYLTDPLLDEDDEGDPELSAAADAHTEGLREAMADLDQAINLVGVLMASMEPEGDSRAMQAETVLKIVEKKLGKAHTRIDRQEARHRNVFLAYFELKERMEKGAE